MATVEEADLEDLAERLTLKQFRRLVLLWAERHARSFKYATLLLVHGEDLPDTRIVVTSRSASSSPSGSSLS